MDMDLVTRIDWIANPNKMTSNLDMDMDLQDLEELKRTVIGMCVNPCIVRHVHTSTSASTVLVLFIELQSDAINRQKLTYWYEYYE